ncbi:hypothetical protein INT43_007178 [Umbelopsis isabellina]|uniref:Nucleolar complex-associated protein 3 n=1 Tax=Mortierella isabellina TaxID=91625 RepID=A0A8H7Q023_MORIS|nr:hypothetical protein INT43_007178 [Umbelopsis isabellina]
MPAKKRSAATKPSIKVKNKTTTKASQNSSKAVSKKPSATGPPKKKEAKKSKIPEYVEVPTVDDEDIELSDEDMQFFEEHGDFTSFLKSMDSKAITKNDATVKKPVTRAPARSVPEPTALSSSEDEDSDMEDGDVEMTQLNSSDEEDENEDQEEPEVDDTEETISESEEEDDAEDFAGSDVEQDYELRPRKVAEEWTKKDKFTKLPIKLPGGKWEQAAEESSQDEDEGQDEEVFASDDEVSEIEMEEPEAETLETPKNKKQAFLEKKEELAQIASTIMEDPEANMALMKVLRTISNDNNPKIRQLALLTQLAVYKDVAPGYRIRPLTDKEEQTQVSKDVKKLRNFEQGLLSNYQAYLTDLERISKTKPAEGSTEKEDKTAMVATQCMCQLLTNLTHFNFRLNIMTAVITKMSTVQWTNVSAICCNSIIEVFKNDESGEASLDAVKLITRMVKSKGHNVNDAVINSFLHLRLKDELAPLADRDGEHMKGKKRQKVAKHHISKKQRKVMKENKEVEKELREAEEVVTKEEKDRNHTETLKLVFACYFRVLKHHQTSKLLPAVLEGLAKFAHLISVDFFRDLLEAMKQVMNSGNTPDSEEESNFSAADTRRRLLCSITAFQLLSGQGEALNLDLQDFYTEIYRLLLPLSLDPDIEKTPISQNVDDDNNETKNHQVKLETEAELVIKSLELMFVKKRHISLPRAAAFIKRFATTALNMPDQTVAQCLTLIKKLMNREARLDALLQSEDKSGNGIYLPTLNDPELSNPFATSIYELFLYQQHYDPNIRALAKSLAAFQPVGKIVRA